MTNLVEKIAANIESIPNTIVFIGAGISINGGMKSWGDSMSEVLEECKRLKRNAAELSFFELLVEEKNYTKFMDEVYDRVGDVKYLNIVQKVFRRECRPTIEHEYWSKIPFAGTITTNFDHLLEITYTTLNSKLPFTQTCTMDGVKRLQSWDKYFLFKMHGDVDNIDEIVLRKYQYDRMIERNDIRELFRKYLLSYQIIFFGYSYCDPDLQAIWQIINSSAKLKAPGILVTQFEMIDTEMRTKLHDLNIHVFQPDKYDQDFSFIPQTLEYLMKSSVGLFSAAPEIKLDEKALLETSMMLIEVFDESKADHFRKLVKSMILSLTIKAGNEGTSIDSVSDKVSSILGLENSNIKNAIVEITEHLTRIGILTSKDMTLRIVTEHRDKYQAARLKFTKQVESIIKSVMERACTKERTLPTVEDEVIFKDLLYRLVQSNGKRLAEYLLFYKRIDTEEQEYYSLINTFIQEKHAESKRDLIRCAITELVNNATPEEERVLFRPIQMYFLTNSYALNPTSEKLLKVYVQQFTTYFDSNVVLQAMAQGHPNHEISVRLIEKTGSLGIKLNLLKVIFNEVVGHAVLALQTFNEIVQAGASSIDAIGAYIELVGYRKCNVFLLGYHSLLRSGKQLEWLEYMIEFISQKKNVPFVFNDKIQEYLFNSLGIEVIEPTFDENEEKEVKRLTDEIVSLRKLGNRFVKEILCADEAKQFLWIYKERSKDKALREKVWFISNDHFIAELFERNKEGYTIPCSYTPLGWYQYMQLVDFDSRANRSFSKLFAFSEIGALDDELAIETIKMLLANESELIHKGAASASEFAHDLINKYHIKAVFEDYAKAKKQGTESKAEFKEKIRDQIKTAFNDYVAIKKIDLNRLEETQKKLVDTQKKLVQEKFKRKQFVAQTNAMKKQRGNKKKSRRG
ncbi:MAG: SIR2 family protein [bacterium]